MNLRKQRIGTHDKRKLRRWELALLLGVAFAALLGVWLNAEQSALSEKVVRLHVLANSDSEADQALKLQVRDRVLEVASDLFLEEQGLTREEAEAAITARLGELAAAGAEVVGAEGYDYPVTVSLERDVWFPTKEYTDFALPAGNYTALRVVIGDGGGRNWWCVVFPPLCLGAVTESTAETAAAGGFSEEDISLITGEDEGYVVKFKAIELWDQFQQWLKGE